jgi:hypothetical protein
MLNASFSSPVILEALNKLMGVIGNGRYLSERQDLLATYAAEAWPLSVVLRGSPD